MSKRLARICALIHLGLIPQHRDAGLCWELSGGSTDRRVLLAIAMALKEVAGTSFGGYPVEGSREEYHRYYDKYMGPYGQKRRELAQQLAVYFWRKQS